MYSDFFTVKPFLPVYKQHSAYGMILSLSGLKDLIFTSDCFTDVCSSYIQSGTSLWLTLIGIIHAATTKTWILGKVLLCCFFKKTFLLIVKQIKLLTINPNKNKVLNCSNRQFFCSLKLALVSIEQDSMLNSISLLI